MVGTLCFTSQAQAGVVVTVGVGGPFYYGPGYYPWYHGYYHGGYYNRSNGHYRGSNGYYRGGYYNQGSPYSHH